MSDLLPGPVAFPARARRDASSPPTLLELVVARRFAGGERLVDIGRAPGMNSDSVAQTMRRLRKRFGVATNPELLALPEFQEMIKQ